MKEFLKVAIRILPNKWQIWLNFRVRVGYFYSLNSPSSFNEKIQARKLENINPLFVTCSDKLKVREYVKDKVGEKYLIPLLYSGDDICKKDLELLGGDYVVKTTHDSGGVYVVPADDSADLDEVVDGLKASLLHDFGKEVSENWYSKIRPRVIAEKMLNDSSGGIPKDFKFHIFNNGGYRKIILQVDYDRYSDHNRTFYDEELNVLPFGLKYPNYFKEIGVVKNYSEMLSVIKKLAEDFEYSRVDLYNVDGRIYFGELTFAPGSGFERFSDKKFDFELGSYWGKSKVD